jgi:hypothetical protein
MAMGRRKQREKQEEIWIAHTELASAPGHPFYQKLNEVLEGDRFDEFVEGLCPKFYAEKYGRPSLTPGIYFRLLHKAPQRQRVRQTPGNPALAVDALGGPSVFSPKCSCAPRTTSPAWPPRRCGSPCRLPTLRCRSGSPWAGRPAVGPLLAFKFEKRIFYG